MYLPDILLRQDLIEVFCSLFVLINSAYNFFFSVTIFIKCDLQITAFCASLIRYFSSRSWILYLPTIKHSYYFHINWQSYFFISFFQLLYSKSFSSSTITIWSSAKWSVKIWTYACMPIWLYFYNSVAKYLCFFLNKF